MSVLFTPRIEGIVGYRLPQPHPTLLYQKHFFALRSLQFNIPTHACFEYTCSHHQNSGGSEFHKVERHCKPSMGLQCRAQRKQIFMVDFFFSPIMCHRSVSFQLNSRTSKGRNPRLSIKRLKYNREFCSFPVMTH